MSARNDSSDPAPPGAAPSAVPPVAPPKMAASLPSATDAAAKPVSQLTPEEQMALFEKELKETDWGHQPC